MATNDFKSFATGTGANVMSQADYLALSALLTGFQSGKASSAQVNKAIRQAMTIAALVGQFIANANIDALDNGDVTGLVTKFTNALNANLNLKTAATRDVGTGTNQIPDMSFFAGLKGANGYKHLPGGDLLQWGTVGLKSAPSGTSIGTFPKAFPTAGQQIVVTHDNPLTNVMAFGAASIINTTQFRVNAIAINSDTFTMASGFDLTLRYFAIGS